MHGGIQIPPPAPLMNKPQNEVMNSDRAPTTTVLVCKLIFYYKKSKNHPESVSKSLKWWYEGKMECRFVSYAPKLV